MGRKIPNWCSNTLELTGPSDKIASIKKDLVNIKGENFFNIFVPDAVEAGKEDEWYSYNLETYGCKWNCNAFTWDDTILEDKLTGKSTISISFDSPWGPPIALYDNLVEQEFEVSAKYYECGMGFVGEYRDNEDTCYNFSDESSLDNIPEDLVEYWDIRGQMADWDE